MNSILLSALVAIGIVYGVLSALLHYTQSRKEPRTLQTIVPFLDPALGIAKHKVNYFVDLRYVISP